MKAVAWCGSEKPFLPEQNMSQFVTLLTGISLHHPSAVFLFTSRAVGGDRRCCTVTLAHLSLNEGHRNSSRPSKCKYAQHTRSPLLAHRSEELESFTLGTVPEGTDNITKRGWMDKKRPQRTEYVFQVFPYRLLFCLIWLFLTHPVSQVHYQTSLNSCS